jgi:acyl-CoA synthetase (AMP-forming)/AMP-acid ligase II
MQQWNYGDMLEAIEPLLPPDRPAYVHGERVISWGEAARRSNNVARALLARGPRPATRSRSTCAIGRSTARRWPPR